ncbi:MAG TPA: T9SS C-terminal target domain-containing protein [Verrucomicrobiae bacterium]|nr:T9SS C-terminal target domain-containing protein [Verrucomicrobiae bacterium]
MQKTHLTFVAAALMGLGPQLCRAQLLKIDINASTGRADTTAPGYTRWDINGDLTGDKRVATRAFTNAASEIITCTIAQTVPTNVDSTIYLFANWLNKDGTSTSPDPNAGWRLAFDGVWVHNKDDSISVDRPCTNGAISLTISNLSAGPHTITTYHNDIWYTNKTYGTMSKCNIIADGDLVATVAPSLQVHHDYDCGFAFFSVNAVAGQPVVINFEPDHSSAFDNVILNGFEIDRATAPGFNAVAAVPGDGDEHVFANNDEPVPGSAGTGSTTLSWTPSQFAATNDVYFGTNSNAVNTATHASPEFKGSQTNNTWNATNLDSALTYYWRIDEVDATNGVFKGDVWRFRTRHLAFPGAEGYGRFARGGRGGRVIEVTNLLDYDATLGEPVIPGSYRAAIEATGPRTVVFRVSGLIRLKRPCTINSTNGYLTVAGQTAPGEGICLSQWRAGITSCSDVIIRFIRCRLGDYSQQAMDGIGLGNSNHSIIDHCSISWTMDEATSSRQSGAVGSGSANITFQHNLISEALDHSYHYDDSQTDCTNCYQRHAFAASISGEIGSYHHNLIAHCTQRNWSLAGGLDQSSHYAGSLDIRNNVVYNWASKTTDGGVARANYVNNYYKPYTNGSYSVVWLLRLDNLNPAWGTETYYMDGNVMEGKDYDTNNWASPAFYNGTDVMNQVRTNQEVFPSYVTTQSARDAFKTVLSDVGCNLPVPDVIDQRVIQEVLYKTTHYIGTNGPNYTINGVPQPGSPNYPGIIDTQTDVHDVPTNSPNFPWPAYNTFDVPLDTDHDGLPDWWEAIHGTDTNSPPGDYSDSNADPDGDGYTDLEDYLNWMAAPHVFCGTNSLVDVDLSQFTVGFTNAPVYGVSDPTNGTVSLLEDGKTACFVPTTGFTGLGSFRFTVVDADGSTLTNMIGVAVASIPQVPNLSAFEQWQTDYFGSTTNAAADPNADPDGDGQNNMAEFLSGTNPTNNLSSLRIISAVRQSNDVIITWTTAGGRTNAVQTTSGNGTGGYGTNFTDLGGPIIVSGIGDVTTNYVDGSGATNAPARYYRVRLVP